jgi:hypothetical protein
MTPSTATARSMTDAELLRLREHWVGVQRGAGRKVAELDREIRTRPHLRQAPKK